MSTDLILGIFVVLEQRVRLRSWRNRHGSRADHGSLLVVLASVLAGVGEGSRWPRTFIGDP
ncbi:MAG: hypothetical protein WBP81_03190 [Solirubrobacteraceae bacterium]